MNVAVRSQVVGWMLVAGLLGSAGALLADQPGVKELEVQDVNEAEKVKWARATTVPIIDAIKTATRHTAGQVIQATLESLGGRLLYEIEIVTGNGKVVEVFVDPRTGKLVEQGGKK
jgi:uncharacterized membrane protein YkoI